MAKRPIGVLFVLMTFFSAIQAAFAAQSALKTPIVKALKPKVASAQIQTQKPLYTYQLRLDQKKLVVYGPHLPPGWKKPDLATTKAPAPLVAKIDNSHPAMMTSISVAPVKAASPSPFKMVVGLTGSSNFYKQSSPDREAYTELLLSPSYSFGENIGVALKASITREEAKTRNTTLSHTTVAMKVKGPVLSSDLSTSGQVIAILPTNEESRKNDSFQGAAGIGGALKYVWKKVGIGYSLTVLRNIHEYTINADGSPNMQYGLSQGLSLDIELMPQLAFSTSGVYRQGWTYKNFNRQSYGFDAGLSYSLNKSWSLSAGVSNAGPAFKANGTASNIKVYDQNTSVIQAGVTFVN